MLGASETPYDLRFRLLDIPVRVHPLFWVISAVMGWQDHNLPMVAFWVACVFFSVLVHEYGHGLMAMRFHTSPSILLYSMGGLVRNQVESTDSIATFPGADGRTRRGLRALFRGDVARVR